MTWFSMKTLKHRARTRDDVWKVREWFYGSIPLPSYIISSRCRWRCRCCCQSDLLTGRLTDWAGPQAAAAGCERSQVRGPVKLPARREERRVLLCNKNKSGRSHQSGLAELTKKVKKPGVCDGVSLSRERPVLIIGPS